jgi:uncharacterized protein YgiM (DUF1202 family)
MNKRTVSLAAAALIAVTATICWADSLWVKSESVDIRAGKGAAYEKVGTAQKGQELNVVSRDGKWIQVQSGNVTGWVFESALSPQKVNGGGGLIAIAPGTVAQMSESSASRGLNPMAEQYVASKRMDKRPLEGLITLRNSITGKEWEQFSAQVRAPGGAGQR